MRPMLGSMNFALPLAGLILGLLAVPDPGQEDQRSCRTDYVIHASVDGETKKLDGSLQVTWKNNTNDSVKELYFHLYHNAFANNRSTHMSEPSRRGRSKPQPEDYGWQRITSIRVGDDDLMPTLRYETPTEESDGTFAPDDEDRFFSANDFSVFRVELTKPATPGETIVCDLEWEAQVPRVRRRTGHKDNFFLMAHWFPKLGVYEGGRGWNCHRFHANTEFYADFGTYDVTLDLPAEYEGHVRASGVLDRERKSGDRVELRFLAPSEADRESEDKTGKRPLLHGFAWTADPDFVVKSFTFKFDDWAEKYADEVEFVQGALGADKDISLRDVEVSVMIQPEREGQAERHFEATAAALFFYGLWYGEYPYEHITVVDPAWGGRAAGGMEYPTLFTCGSSLCTFKEMHRPESVTVHECGHQFWYGLVGNNEFEASWLDEGLNSFTDSEVLFNHYGPSHGTTSYSGMYLDGVRLAPLPGGNEFADAISAQRIELPFDFTLRPLRSSAFVDWWRDQPLLTLSPQRRDTRWGDRSGYLRDPDTDPIDTIAYEYADGSSYSTNSYSRTATALRTLMGVVGREKFLRGMRSFSEDWRYRHPYPEDFYAGFADGSGEDIGWYFEEVFKGTGTVDWQVSVTQRRASDARGWFPDEETGEFEKKSKKKDTEEESEGEAEEDEASEDEEEKPAKKPYLIEILVRRDGTLSIPLPIEWTFADESDADDEEEGEESEPAEPRRERRIWTREEQLESNWLRIRFESDTKLKSVVLDPERVLYLDQDMSNNQWHQERDEVAPLRWAERVFTQYSHLYHWQADIGG